MGRKKVYIKGNHPIREYIQNQYVRNGMKVYDYENNEVAFLYNGKDVELVILTSLHTSDRMEEDYAAIAFLKEVAEKISNEGNIRPVVHVLFQSSVTLDLLLKHDLPFSINEKMDVYPFTMEDMWAKKVLVGLPGVTDLAYPPLDRQSITSDSKNRIHLVIDGFDSQAEAFAIHTALIAHFPNYRNGDELPVRTRITIIDREINIKRDAFIAKYQSLFDHSFYRTIMIADRRCEFHRPMYDGVRKDFVDIEWEFVEGCITDSVIRDKIITWAVDSKQQLTLLISHQNVEENMNLCMSLPRIVHEKEIPVFVRMYRKALADAFVSSVSYNHIYPLGMYDCGYDVTMPLVKMAKLLKYFYDCSYGDKGILTEFLMDEVNEAWKQEHSMKMRFSNIYNVMTIPTKMHSVGHSREDADTFYALNHSEIQSLAETEHNRWSVERLILGDRPCTNEEREEISRNIKEIIEARRLGKDLPTDLKRKFKKEYHVHYDLCAYDDLGMDPTGKNAQIYDYDLTASIPLIYKTYYGELENGNETD